MRRVIVEVELTMVFLCEDHTKIDEDLLHEILVEGDDSDVTMQDVYINHCHVAYNKKLK